MLEESLSQFNLSGLFEAYRQDNEDSITIRDCRMTRTTNEPSGHRHAIVSGFPEVSNEDTVIALYLRGIVLQDRADPSKSTASGRCVFLVSNLGQHPGITQTQITVPKDSFFYYKIAGGDRYIQARFSEIRNFINAFQLVSTSSMQTHHLTANIRLFPDR
jgi:hypothetical protein